MSALDWYAVAAGSAFLAGAFRKGSRLLRAGGPEPVPLPRAPPGRAPSSALAALALVAVGPFGRFSFRANPVWTIGCAAYHAALAVVAVSYVLSAALLVARAACGAPVPDALTGAATPAGGGPANLLALVFGNTDPVAARFLFGRLAGPFRAAMALDLALALAGNLCLVATLVRRDTGAVLRDIDAAAAGVRRGGASSGERWAVRTLVFLIIQTELLARLGWREAVRLHVLLGLAFLAILPFCTLSHALCAPLAMRLAVRRRRAGVTA